MKYKIIYIKFLILIICLGMFSCFQNQEDELVELWYNQPATIWEEALPIGNGRLGAMIYGKPVDEKIQFNEETLWDCAPRDYHREDAHQYLAEIRNLLFENKHDEAEKLAMAKFMGRKAYEDDFQQKKEYWVDSILQLKTVKQAILSDYNDDAWPEMLIDYKSVWERKGLADMNGAVLFRKSVDIPALWNGKDLVINLGKIKDQDFCYFNGKIIGSTDESNTNRTYTIPSELVKLKGNKIAVLINNYVSTGGFNAVRTGHKKMNIISQEDGVEPVFIEGNWKYQVIDTKPPSYPQYQADYQPFGTINLKFQQFNRIENYRRSLELDNALVRTSFEAEGVEYKREYLASYPDNLIAIKLSANKKGKIYFESTFETLHPLYSLFKIDEHTLALSLQVEDGEMQAVAYLNITTENGEVNVSDKFIEVSGANEATLKLIAATNYIAYNNISGKPDEDCQNQLQQIATKDYKQIKSKHLQDYCPIYNRFSIDLQDYDKKNIPTDERILNIKNEEDKDLVATYVQYARYLMLASGREGTNPPNLQGIWNDKIYPAWGSKYTTNINCEMNFWPVEPLNIAECHNTLFKLIDEVATEGAKTAKSYYNAKGWVHHHNTDQWRGTAPINNSNHGIWPTGGAWLSHHLWEHYLYSGDLDFLRNRAYPVLKGAAEFFNDFLIEDPKTGFLISTPSNSPEQGGLVSGPAMDHQIIRSLFKIVIECTKLLNIDRDFASTLESKLEMIAPDQVGRLGQLQEWQEDIDDPKNRHRHVSHLWGVHPGHEITWGKSPDFMKAARQSLRIRGDEGTGWSLAWKINLWARFLEGDHANNLVQMLLSSAVEPGREVRGGSYPNLFDAHPPFQIDGNFGGAAGIVEMLMQSHQGYIHILPALPSTWLNGSISGLRCRGGFEMDMEWQKGALVRLKVKSNLGNNLFVKYKGKTIKKETEARTSYDLSNLITNN